MQVMLSTHPDYQVGDKVLAPFDAGKKILDFDAGDVQMEGISVIYGQAIVQEMGDDGQIYEEVQEVKMSTQIPAKLEGGITPVDDQILILRDPIPEAERGILLTQSSRQRETKAKALRCGSKCSDVKEGDCIVYYSAGIFWIDLEADPELRESVMEAFDLPRERLKDLALISESDVCLIYEE